MEEYGRKEKPDGHPRAIREMLKAVIEERAEGKRGRKRKRTLMLYDVIDCQDY